MGDVCASRHQWSLHVCASRHQWSFRRHEARKKKQIADEMKYWRDVEATRYSAPCTEHLDHCPPLVTMRPVGLEACDQPWYGQVGCGGAAQHAAALLAALDRAAEHGDGAAAQAEGIDRAR